MIARTLAAKAIALAQKFQVITLTGPRQSGKTTLVRTVFPGLPYVSLEEPDIRQIALTDPGPAGGFRLRGLWRGTVHANQRRRVD